MVGNAALEGGITIILSKARPDWLIDHQMVGDQISFLKSQGLNDPLAGG